MTTKIAQHISKRKHKRLHFLWLKQWPMRGETKIYFESGRDEPYLYLGLGRFVIAWDTRPAGFFRRKNDSPAKVLTFRRKEFSGPTVDSPVARKDRE